MIKRQTWNDWNQSNLLNGDLQLETGVEGQLIWKAFKLSLDSNTVNQRNITTLVHIQRNGQMGLDNYRFEIERERWTDDSHETMTV